jgi:hypothetical protein
MRNACTLLLENISLNQSPERLRRNGKAYTKIEDHRRDVT